MTGSTCRPQADNDRARRGVEPSTVGLVRTRLRVPPLAAGTYQLSVRARALRGEQVSDNNVFDTMLEVRPGPARVLYLEGEPRPEFAFLRRAMAADSALQVVGLVPHGRAHVSAIRRARQPGAARRLSDAARGAVPVQCRRAGERRVVVLHRRAASNAVRRRCPRSTAPRWRSITARWRERGGVSSHGQSVCGPSGAAVQLHAMRMPCAVRGSNSSRHNLDAGASAVISRAPRS